MSGLAIKDLMNVKISSTGIGFPQEGRWLNNEQIHTLIYGDNCALKMQEQKLDPNYYESELGFKKRFWVHTPGSPVNHSELTSADLMVAAAKDALKNGNFTKEDVDFIIAVTITSPKYSTSMGPYIAGKLGIVAPSMEMKSGCASNIFSIIFASQLIQSGARNVLIACGETTSKILKLNSTMAYAGGDAGAAIIVSKATSSTKGILAAYLNTDGSYSTHMGVPGLMPPNKKDLDEENYYLTYSDKAEEFLNYVWSATPKILYENAGLNSGEIDCLIPHQVLKKRTEFVSKAAQIPLNKTIDILADYANCGSASLLLALHHAKKNGQLKDDQIAMLLAAGGGVSWGGIILKT